MSLDWNLIEPIAGWLTKGEGQMLYDAALAVTPGRIVELGSYCGRSTACLAMGVRDSGEAEFAVVTIDTHKGSPEHQKGKKYFRRETYRNASVNTLPLLMANLQMLGIEEYVDVLVGDSVLAAHYDRKDVHPSLLFIDAQHTESAVRQDVSAWLPKVVKGGIVMFHDYGAWPGVTKVVDEMIEFGELAKMDQEGSLIACRKL